MSFEILKEPLFRKYRAPFYSAACLYAIVFGFLLIFIPFLIAYNSDNFWLKEKVEYEQLDVSYRYHAMFQVTGGQPDKPLNLYYSSSNKVNALMQERARMSVLKSAPFDDNMDGILDRLEIGLQMPLYNYENVTSISGMVSHSVRLKTRAKYSFDSVSYFNFESGTPLGAVAIDGDIMLRQTEALTKRGGFKLPYKGDALVKVEEDSSATDFAFDSVLRRAAARNLSTAFQPTYKIGTPAPVHNVIDDMAPRFLNVTLTMRVPLQPVLVNPTASEVVKLAWIQYLSFFLLIAFLMQRLSAFIFRHRLIYADCVVDVAHEKRD